MGEMTYLSDHIVLLCFWLSLAAFGGFGRVNISICKSRKCLKKERQSEKAGWSANFCKRARGGGGSCSFRGVM
ncbi:hypothetical protein GGU10DRAFT_339431 [Lentinula aff. detonsa]|uniref:Uncharacterized protein n=1 Tax=Lentinula aff. detonsa TaxID=2804958 RepID=A0AA38U0P1_9AGAR|nr:hypothetical protein GGU10DRAFT_339431 [Lentinula aff. detonsa]